MGSASSAATGDGTSCTLYIYGLSAPSRAAWMAAKASKIPIHIKYIDLFKAEHKAPEFQRLNPDTTVPTLVDGDFCLWESRPVMMYLVNQYGKNPNLYPNDLKKRAQVDRLLNYDLGSVYKTVSEYVYPQIFQNKPPDVDKEMAMKRTFEYLNRQLEGTSYMAGNLMTLVDLSMASNISLLELKSYKMDEWPNVSAWYQRMKEQPFWSECNKGLYDWRPPPPEIKI